MMSGIRGKNTKPEMLLRSGLHRRGLRFGSTTSDFLANRTSSSRGGMQWCSCTDASGMVTRAVASSRSRTLGQTSGSRRFAAIKARDALAIEALESKGWRVAVVWECATRDPKVATVDVVEAWLRGEDEELEVAG